MAKQLTTCYSLTNLRRQISGSLISLFGSWKK